MTLAAIGLQLEAGAHAPPVSPMQGLGGRSKSPTLKAAGGSALSIYSFSFALSVLSLALVLSLACSANVTPAATQMAPTSTSDPTTEEHKSESSAGTTVDSTDDTRQQRTAGSQGVNCYSTFDSTDICYAIGSGNAEVVQKLVEAGADVNAVTEEGALIVTIAVSPVNPNPEIMRILIDAGADVNAETEFHGSLLNAAITTLGDNIEASAYIAIVEMLVNAGADVNWTDPYNNPVLAGAVNSGNAEIVRILVEAGADPSDHGLLRLAFSDERDDYHWEIVRMLVEAGADPNERNTEKGGTALSRAVATGNVEAMSFLVAAGANPNDGLLAAFESGDAESMRILFDAGANPNSGIF